LACEAKMTAKSPLGRFLDRYAGRTLIVHSGFPPQWLEELLKQPGGGGHFRVDTRQIASGRQTPVEWLLQRHVLPLNLPHPLVIKVSRQAIYMRHLTRAGEVVHPSEIYWFVEEIEDRHHARLLIEGANLAAERGLDPAENEAKAFLDSLGGL